MLGTETRCSLPLRKNLESEIDHGHSSDSQLADQTKMSTQTTNVWADGTRWPQPRGLADLLPEAAALCKPGLAAGGRAEHGAAVAADHHCLCMGENCSNCEAVQAPNVHEERVRLLNQPLELVLALLIRLARVEEILNL